MSMFIQTNLVDQIWTIIKYDGPVLLKKTPFWPNSKMIKDLKYLFFYINELFAENVENCEVKLFKLLK